LLFIPLRRKTSLLFSKSFYFGIVLGRRWSNRENKCFDFGESGFGGG
jgi:hypothetical protein